MKKIFANKKVFIGMMSALIVALIVPTVVLAYQPYEVGDKLTGSWVDPKNTTNPTNPSQHWYYADKDGTGYQSHGAPYTENGYNPTNFGSSTDDLRISGSTTLYPIMNAAGLKTAFTTFEASNGKADITMDVRQGGSGVGKDDLGLGVTDIGMSSSDLSTWYNSTGASISESNFLYKTAIGLDGLCIVVHKGYTGVDGTADDDPDDITSLTLQQVWQIYNKSVSTWNELGSASTAPIVARARIVGSGSRASLMDMTKSAGGGTNFNDAFISSGRLEGNPEMQSAVNGTVNSIGYVGLGFDSGANIRTIQIKLNSTATAYSPTPMNIYSTNYKLARKLFLLTKGTTAPTVNTTSRDLLDFMTDVVHDQTRGQNWVQAAEPVGGGFLKLVPDQDVNMDHTVSALDFADAGYHLDESLPGTAGFERSDVNNDNVVSALDFAEIGYWDGISY